MREKIINILQDTDWSDNGIENMTDKILLLFSDVGRSEQLVCEWCEKPINKGVLCDDCNEE